MAIEVFNRYEYKYKITEAELNKLLPVLEKHMLMDMRCKNHSLYTIANIYYDTYDDYLIRRSLQKPAYKEKLRLRAYGVPELDSKVFLEIKKKVKGLVNKRRTTLILDEAYGFIQNGKMPEPKEYMNTQVMHELEYFLKVHNIMPKVYIAYDRLAYFENGNDDLRISFDTNIRTRRHDLRLEAGDHGDLLLDEDVYIMEIKTSRAMPIWLTELLTEMNMRRSSFSKYGTEFKEFMTSNTGVTENFYQEIHKIAI